jgi:hypothetical protein
VLNQEVQQEDFALKHLTLRSSFKLEGWVSQKLKKKAGKSILLYHTSKFSEFDKYVDNGFK